MNEFFVLLAVIGSLIAFGFAVKPTCQSCADELHKSVQHDEQRRAKACYHFCDGQTFKVTPASGREVRYVCTCENGAQSPVY
jgi:hypothetical protein